MSYLNVLAVAWLILAVVAALHHDYALAQTFLISANVFSAAACVISEIRKGRKQ